MASRQKPLAEDVIARLEALGRGRRLDPELVPVDRLLRRWAVSIGDGLPSEEWQDNPKARVPPLDDTTAILVDRIVLAAPGRTRRMVKLWYKSNQPREVIAGIIGVARSAVYVEHKAALWYVRGACRGAGIDC